MSGRNESPDVAADDPNDVLLMIGYPIRFCCIHLWETRRSGQIAIKIRMVTRWLLNGGRRAVSLSDCEDSVNCNSNDGDGEGS